MGFPIYNYEFRSRNHFENASFHFPMTWKGIHRYKLLFTHNSLLPQANTKLSEINVVPPWYNLKSLCKLTQIGAVLHRYLNICNYIPHHLLRNALKACCFEHISHSTIRPWKLRFLQGAHFLSINRYVAICCAVNQWM